MIRKITTSVQRVAAAVDTMHPSFMVIGYGNTLRGDDGLGPHIAQIVEAWHLPAVATIAAHQLTPELAAALQPYDQAIFVDAHHTATHAASAAASVRIQGVKPALYHTAQTHIASPEHVLALAQALYGYCPQAWLVSIQAERFDIGAPLSAAAAHRRYIALLVIRFIITTQRGMQTSDVLQGQESGIVTLDVA
jgi:hydrogenase maturation protease